jgi:hypothetical protein
MTGWTKREMGSGYFDPVWALQEVWGCGNRSRRN